MGMETEHRTGEEAHREVSKRKTEIARLLYLSSKNQLRQTRMYVSQIELRSVKAVLKGLFNIRDSNGGFKRRQLVREGG